MIGDFVQNLKLLYCTCHLKIIVHFKIVKNWWFAVVRRITPAFLLWIPESIPHNFFRTQSDTLRNNCNTAQPACLVAWDYFTPFPFIKYCNLLLTHVAMT